MCRFFLLIFCFFSFLNANEFIKKVEIIELKQKEFKIKDVKSSKNFKRTNFPLILKSKNTYLVKITFNKQAFKNDNYSIELLNEFNIVTLEKHIRYRNILKNKVIPIKQNDTLNELYIKINNEENYINFDINITKSEVLFKKQLLINKLFGIAYGIIFAAFLYNFALYIFLKDITYLYYSLTQVSMFAILLFVTFEEFKNDKIIIEFILLTFLIFSSLFTKNFLNTKKYTPIINNILSYGIWFFIIDFVFSNILKIITVSDFIPISFIQCFYILAAFIVYRKGHKEAIFYIIAWGIVIVSFLIIQMQVHAINNSFLSNTMYILHIIIPIESLILAFALSYKMQVLKKEKDDQQEYLIHQSKLASMGEMISNIAHQWRQPLTHISFILMNMKTAYSLNKLTDKYFYKKINDASSQLEYMSNTINDFTNFFKMNKNKENFSINASINEVLVLLNASLKNSNIKIEFIHNSSFNIYSYKGEFLQVLFNVINNAKEELISNNIENPIIKIYVNKIEKNIQINILDNGLGIKSENLSRIFEPYFTSKEDGQGIGLYMSKMIVERNMKGSLYAKEITKGANFIISLPAN